MKIKIKKIVQPEIAEEQEVEISLPRFSKEGSNYFMLIGDRHTVSVDTQDNYPSIMVWNGYSGKADEAVAAPEISEEEFMLAYNTAKNLIEVEMNKVLQTV